jgi:hypothetical protein
LKLHQKYQIVGAYSQLVDFAKALGERLESAWKTARPVAQPRDGRLFTFYHAEEGALPPANAFLAVSSDGHTDLVVLLEHGDSSARNPDVHNALIESFAAFATPLAIERGLSVRKTSSAAELSEWISSEAEQRLRAFSRRYLASTPDPKDSSGLELFFGFIIQCRRDGRALPTNILETFLTEEENWPAEDAADVGHEYDFGLGLLDQNEKR